MKFPILGDMTMAEYIEREAFIKNTEARYCDPCKEIGKDSNGLKCRACWVDDMVGEIEDAPTIGAVPVVRCSECKFYETAYYDEGTKQVCRLLKRQFQDDDFCSYGERKEGAE